MGAMILRVEDDTLARLEAIAEEHDVSLDVVLRRLLDRDPHMHGHACPTCARIARREQIGAHPDEQPMFAVGGVVEHDGPVLV